MGRKAKKRVMRRGYWSLEVGRFGCGTGCGRTNLYWRVSDRKAVVGERGRLKSRQNRGLWKGVISE